MSIENCCSLFHLLSKGHPAACALTASLMLASCSSPRSEAKPRVKHPTSDHVAPAPVADSPPTSKNLASRAAPNPKKPVDCAAEHSQAQLETMLSAMLNAKYFSQFLILENPDAVPVRINVSTLDPATRAKMLGVEIEHFGEKVDVAEGAAHPAAILFRRWERSGNRLSIETRFPARSVAGEYEFLCASGEWALVRESGYEYKPVTSK